MLFVRDKHIVGVGDPGSPRFDGQPKLRARYLIASRIKRGKLGIHEFRFHDKFPRTEIIASRYSVISIHREREREGRTNCWRDTSKQIDAKRDSRPMLVVANEQS